MIGYPYCCRVIRVAVYYLIDRLIHHSRLFQITGNAYRMKDYKLEREQRSKKKTPDDPR